MHTRRLKWLTVSLVCLMAASAQASVRRDVLRGFELFGWQFAAQRNILGDGWDFTAFADYRAGRTFNFGVGSLTLEDALVTASTGWTLRGIPMARFSLSTNDTPLSYTYKLNTGWQNMSLSGNVLFNMDMEVNPIGFYDQTIQISNRATLQSLGVLGEQTQDFDYDIGPVDISGNIYLDALAAITQPFFDATGAANPFVKLSPRALRIESMTERVEDLRARVAAGHVLTDEQMATLISDSVMLSMLDPSSSIGSLGDAIAPEILMDKHGTGSGSSEISAYMHDTPEPGTLALLIVGLAALLTPRIGRRRR